MEQFGLGVLEGMATGLGSLVRNSVGRFNFDSPWAISSPRSRLRFSGAEGVAFELIRHAGARTRFDVKVDDPRANRLLVLSVVRLFELKTGGLDPRKLGARMGGLFGRG